MEKQTTYIIYHPINFFYVSNDLTCKELMLHIKIISYHFLLTILKHPFQNDCVTYSLNLRLCILSITPGVLSSPESFDWATRFVGGWQGEVIPELRGLPPGEKGDMLRGEFWLIGESVLTGGVVKPFNKSMLFALEAENRNT